MALKEPDPDTQKGLTRLPEDVRNKMGYMKKGGKVSKADMQKAGFYDKGKTTSERKKIVSKVTTKPQRVAMVEKMFSAKGSDKVKKFESGGDVYDNYDKRSRINDAIRKEGLAPYEIKELEMRKPKDKIDKTIKSMGDPIGKGPGESFNYEKAEKALADYRARMGSDAGGKTIIKDGGGSGGGGGGIPKLNRDITKNMKSGGKVSSASKRADGCAIRGKTRA